jgi:hypothetical protein
MIPNQGSRLIPRRLPTHLCPPAPLDDHKKPLPGFEPRRKNVWLNSGVLGVD